MAELGRRLAQQLPGLEAMISREDHDPFAWL
jgi:hypothetical protein